MQSATAMRGILEITKDSNVPFYLQISSGVDEALRHGRLRSGMRLPSERDLARALGVSRTTVVAAYEDIESRGLVRRQVGRGTFICAPESLNSSPFAWEGKLSMRSATDRSTASRSPSGQSEQTVISFAAALPATEVFPRDGFRKLIDSAVSKDLPSLLGFSPPHGQLRLREAIAGRLNVPVERVLIVSGSQEAFDLIGRCLTDRGDNVAADDPGSRGFRRALAGHGCSILPWQAPNWESGALEHLILRYEPRFLYTNPTFHNPTGRSMPQETREELVELSQRYRMPIVEDIAFVDLALKPAPTRTLAQLDPSVVIQVGTFSPTLGPGLRLGFVIAPPAFVNQLAWEKERSSSFTSGIGQYVVGEFLRSGMYEQHLDRLRHEHQSRLHSLLASIQRRLTPADVKFTAPGGGLFLWMRLVRGISAEELRRVACELGVDFTPGSELSGSAQDLPYIRLCFTAVCPSQIDEGVRRLALAIKGVSESTRQETGFRISDQPTIPTGSPVAPGRGSTRGRPAPDRRISPQSSQASMAGSATGPLPQ